MTATLIRNRFNPGRYNNYLIAGNVCNAFVLGEVGSQDDFFLVGAEPDSESNYPLLTGNVLDSEGNVLFRLVRNILVFNPGHCSRIFGDHIGYEIHDSSGKLIFRVKTKFETLPDSNEEMFVTSISATFYDKTGELVFMANSGDENERIESRVKSAYGFSGGFGLVQGMGEEEISLARVVLATGGTVHQLLSGKIEGKEVLLDGKAISDAQFSNCKIIVRSGEFASYGVGNSFTDCTFIFEGAAENIRQMVMRLAQK